MSADNWRTCPRCEHKARDEYKKELKAAEDSYGKVKVDKYMQLMAKAQKPFKIEETLREYFWQGILGNSDDYDYNVWYKCSCTECGWSFEYKHREKTDCITLSCEST